MRKIKVLVVGTRAFAQLLEHLFSWGSEFKMIGRVEAFRALASTTDRAPGLIIATLKPVGIGVGSAIASVKKFSPSSKLILICPVREFVRGARESGADACLDQETLVFRLLPTARVLSRKPRRT